MITRVTTDWHLAVRRISGTTPVSQQELRGYLRSALKNQLDDNDHLICGDLLDDFTVDASEILLAYDLFSDWLTTYGKKLALLRGNHDYSVRGTQKSSFDLLASILSAQFPDQVTVATGVTEWKQFVLVPHLPNNEIFSLEVGRLSNVRNKVVVFHANIDNNHAQDSQHSINLSSEQIKDFTKRDNLVLVGHEHQQRSLFNGRCLVLGNGAPSSVADCIGNSKKYAALVTGTEYELLPICDIDHVFANIDWRSTDDVDPEMLFIRVSGNATAEEAAQVVSAIATLRKRHSALVISNAVEIEGMSQFDDLAKVSFEDVAKFDVLGMLLEEFSAKEQEALRSLL